MKHCFILVLTLGLILAACAPAATPTPSSPPAAPAATQEPTVPSVAIKPPVSGGAVVAPTVVATPTTASNLTTGVREEPGWARIEAGNPPPARFDHTLTLDTTANKLVVFGGRDGSKTFGDTWVYDLAAQSWREVKASPAPGARFGHAAAYDARSKRVLIFAGQASGFFNDVWAFDMAKETWQKLETKGTAPAARYGTSAVVDDRTRQLIVTHGFAAGRFDDTFTLNLATNTWSQIKPVEGTPLKRCLHESVYDAKAGRMILFGGCSSGFGPCPQGDLWSLDVTGRTWNEVSPKGSKPSPRSNPALVGDNAGRAILFGGLTSDGPSGDAWSLDIALGAWAVISTSGDAPVSRSSHDAVWNPLTQQVIVFGGKGSSGALNDLWTLTP